MWTCDTGGVLNRVLHLYEYDNFDQRDSCRKATVDSVEWQQQYLANSRKAVEQQVGLRHAQGLALWAGRRKRGGGHE